VDLRPFQEALLADARDAFVQGARAVLIQAPTGAGKTVVMAEAAHRSVAHGTRVLALSHKVELADQMSARLAALGVQHGRVAPGHPKTADPVQVASVQALVRRIGEPVASGFGLILVDEAHHLVPGSLWARILAANTRAAVLGVTATPRRLDGRGLGRAAGGLFDRLILGPSVADLTADGFLVPATVYAPPRTPDLEGIRRVAGDYQRGGLERVMRTPTIVGDAVAHYGRLAAGLTGVAFCVSIAHAEETAAAFRAAGWRAVAVHGDTPANRRAAALAGLADGSVQVLCSCDLLIEGIDVPEIQCAILLRPTASLTVYMQSVGRGLRPAAGKERLVILDHAGNTLRHGLPDAEHRWSLKGTSRQQPAPALRHCPSCGALHRPAPACPECAHEYPAAEGPRGRREIRQLPGELRELTATDRERRMREARERIAARQARREQLATAPLEVLLAAAATRRDIAAIGAARGFRPGWARHRADELGLRR
jgi:superfamily II DNA or RNA helicase